MSQEHRDRAPGLVRPKEYDIRDSNVELIGTEADHRIKHASAATEPAWNDGSVGREPGLRIWRIEDFEVVSWPRDKYGWFYEGDSYIVLHSYARQQQQKNNAGGGEGEEGERGENGGGGGGEFKLNKKLGHDIFFWLGTKTSQDEAGTAAYKTVELDEFLEGAATQHRELQVSPSDAFMALFPRLSIRRGGVASGFRHVDLQEDAAREEAFTLLRVFKHPGAASGRDTVVVHEVEPTWESLDDEDVFILDKGDKIYVWQGNKCSPMEKAKAAQVVHDMTLAKHIDVEVLAQAESKSTVVVGLLGGGDDKSPNKSYSQARPVLSAKTNKGATESGGGGGGARSRRLWRLSDASGELAFELVKEGGAITQSDFDGNDVFLLDDGGKAIWVWEGQGASRGEKKAWLRVAQAYVRRLQEQESAEEAYLTPIAKVQQGCESSAFMKAIQVS